MEKKPIVSIDMNPSDRIRLSNQILAAMEQKDCTPFMWDKLNLGFKLPPGWPVDKEAQPTLAQLVVIARKLDLRVEIADLNLIANTTN
jgi:hypothetical protein